MKQVVGHGFQDLLQEHAGEFRPVGVGIGDRGLVKDVFDPDVLARQQGGAPPEPRGQRDLGFPFLEQRLTDEVVEGAVEISPPVKERFGAAEHPVHLRLVRRPHLLDQRRHRGIGVDDIREHGDQLVAVSGDAAAAHVEVEAGQELAVRTRRHEQGVSHGHCLGQRIVGVRGEYDIDAGDPRGQLAVDVEAVVTEQHDEVDARLAHRVHPLADLVLADAEGPVGDQIPGIGDRRVGIGLADDGDTQSRALEDLHGLEDRLVPGGVPDVAGQERKFQLADEFLNPLGAVGEFPVRGHGLDTQRVHGLDHVRALGFQRRIRTLPGIAAVEQNGLAGALGPDRLDQGRHAVEPADPAVVPAKGHEVLAGERVGLGRTLADSIMVEQLAARKVGRKGACGADADVDGRLAEIDGHQLGVDVGEVEKRDPAQRREAQEVVLGDFLRRRGAAQRSRRAQRRRGHHDLQESTPVKHGSVSPRVCLQKRPFRRPYGLATYSNFRKC